MYKIHISAQRYNFFLEYTNIFNEKCKMQNELAKSTHFALYVSIFTHFSMCKIKVSRGGGDEDLSLSEFVMGDL